MYLSFIQYKMSIFINKTQTNQFQKKKKKKKKHKQKQILHKKNFAPKLFV